MTGFKQTAVFLSLSLLFLLTACGSGAGETAVSAPDLSAYPWVYLRDGKALMAGEPVVSLVAVGDVMLGRGVAAEPEPLAQAAPWLRAADLTLGNLEGVIAPHSDLSPENRPTTSRASRITLTMPPTAVFHLQDAGFDLLGLANNHSLDLGPSGLAETAVRLEEAGLAPIGRQMDGAILPLIRVVNNITLAFFAFNAVPDPVGSAACPADLALPCPVLWQPETALPAIRRAGAAADAVIVSIHWGFEYESRPDPAQEKIADMLRAAGADLIVGHHPHVAQPVAVVDDTVTAFSVGNFVFDQETAATRQGLALLAYFDEAGLRAVQALPVAAGVKPQLWPVAAAGSWLPALLPPPPRLAFACEPAVCLPVAAPSTTTSGAFYSDQIDLTGDGVAETIRLQGARITIYENGTAVWHSPAAWRIVDVALGDPNDDGRFEVMLALWQKDEADHQRSQPYIVGYRGGEYTLLWGGRPVVDPIQEVALGDVDGDGVTELVVINEQADGLAQSVAVWQWQGWTFSLQWQSDPGWYRDLVLAAAGERLLIVVTEAAAE